MAPPALPPRKKKSRQPAATTILSLGDELLREVFLRLPSLPSLVRAALACPAFLRAVRSSPAFRRRFRELHSPTILGAFLVNDEPPMPTFVPVCLRGRHSDPDHAAALRGLDVFLTRLPDAIGDKKYDGEDKEEEAEDEVEKDAEDEVEEDAEDEDEEDTEDEDEDREDEEEDGRSGWSMSVCRDVHVQDEEDAEDEGWYMSRCCDGYVVLVRPRWNTKKVAVYDPLTGALHLFPVPPDEVFSGEPEETEAEYHVIPSEADDRSFRLLCVPKGNGGDQIAVLSPDAMEWRIFPAGVRLQEEGNVKLVKNGLVYWACPDEDEDYIHVLNIATLQFSQIDLPTGLSGVYGETKDGKLCLVRGSDLVLDIWVQRAGKDGVDEWKRDRKFRMVDAISNLDLNIRDECPQLNVVAIIGGIVYLSIHQDEPPNWLLSFCLETRELKKLGHITSFEFCYPYIMAWPPSLVHNKEANMRPLQTSAAPVV
uniref:Uncharacterized protein n=1 Tax=Avena sativa TaxID=4498 RepID=A0ACD5U4F4_AVESA